jgi:hypothetical protein
MNVIVLASEALRRLWDICTSDLGESCDIIPEIFSPQPNAFFDIAMSAYSLVKRMLLLHWISLDHKISNAEAHAWPIISGDCLHPSRFASHMQILACHFSFVNQRL